MSSRCFCDIVSPPSAAAAVLTCLRLPHSSIATRTVLDSQDTKSDVHAPLYVSVSFAGTRVSDADGTTTGTTSSCCGAVLRFKLRHLQRVRRSSITRRISNPHDTESTTVTRSSVSLSLSDGGGSIEQSSAALLVSTSKWGSVWSYHLPPLQVSMNTATAKSTSQNLLTTLSLSGTGVGAGRPLVMIPSANDTVQAPKVLMASP
mmetsp:Transcript_2380/g.8524  ORF Transcript_2380/g.8524 Transcript_2380/m.8524 type:complete len:204 (-) Transcript_2380:3110-3721(-)